MKEEEKLINKYPFLGYSQNIIECFSIIGYEENIIPQIIEEYKKNNDNNIYSPSILSSITSNIDFGLIDNNLIISQIFPYNPTFTKITKNQNNKNVINPEKPETKNVVYSFMIDSLDGKKKLFYTCFGYIFYEKYKYYDSNNNLFSLEEYYVPKAFCILSQYSFFSFFYYICSNLNEILNNKNQKIPMEILIYNIVNFLPAPLNYKLQYNIFSTELDASPYELPQLSGYPFLDFDLSSIFDVLPINLIIEIFLITVIEQSILFFSSDLEILNMVMFIMYSLNYPCNNSTYFWHVVSITKNDLHEENRFVSQIITSFLGVNAEYDESINTFAFGDYHLIVDIDNKKIFYKEKNNINAKMKEEVEKLSNLKAYFSNIIKDKIVESSFLKKFINQLKKDLENIIKEEGNQKIKKKINFFTGKKEKNKLIQECFYNFILNILMIFYKKINLYISLDRIKIELNQKRNLKIIEDKSELSEEEKYFCELFKSTSKYKIYFENFIQNCETHKLFKIPLMISEEFINLKIKSIQNQIELKISLFDIIDNLYSENGTLNVSTNYFIHHFIEDNIKSNFNDNNNQKKDNNSINNDSKLFTFNKNILQKYIYLLNNDYEKWRIKEIFPFLKIKNELVHLIDRKLIAHTIQNSLEKNNLIKTSNYLFYSLIYVFSILMSLYSYRNLLFYIDKLLSCIDKIDFFLRFYFIKIIETFFKYYLINKEKNIYPEMKFNNIKVYFYLFLSHLKSAKILPNEEIFLILKKLYGKNIFRERGSFKEKNSNFDLDLIDYKQQDIELNLKDKNVFQIYMKYSFGFKGFYKPQIIIKSAMKETGNFNISIKDDYNKNVKNDKKRKTPIIITKVKDSVYSSELFSPKKIFKLSQYVYKDFIENSKLDLEYINIKSLREIIVNLIQYSIELNELNIPFDFLVNGLYLTKNLNENFRANSKKTIKNNQKLK